MNETKNVENISEGLKTLDILTPAYLAIFNGYIASEIDEIKKRLAGAMDDKEICDMLGLSSDAADFVTDPLAGVKADRDMLRLFSVETLIKIFILTNGMFRLGDMRIENPEHFSLAETIHDERIGRLLDEILECDNLCDGRHGIDDGGCRCGSGCCECHKKDDGHSRKDADAHFRDLADAFRYALIMRGLM